LRESNAPENGHLKRLLADGEFEEATLRGLVEEEP
jgi:hypothetical protein